MGYIVKNLVKSSHKKRITDKKTIFFEKKSIYMEKT